MHARMKTENKKAESAKEVSAVKLGVAATLLLFEGDRGLLYALLWHTERGGLPCIAASTLHVVLHVLY